MENSLKSLEVAQNIQQIKRMTPAARMQQVAQAQEDGADWQSVYENIRQIIDPMDVMSDTQVFGAEIPWELW